MDKDLIINKLEEKIRQLESELAQVKDEAERNYREKVEFASILAHIPLFIMIVDEERRVKKVSNSVLQFLGMNEDEIINLRGGEALRCVHHLDDPNGCGFGPTCQTCTIRSVVQDTLSTGKSHHQIEARLSSIGDSTDERTLLVSTVLVNNDIKRDAIVFVEDITEKKQAEEALFTREEQQAVISRISQAALANIDIQTLLDETMRFVQQTIKVDLCKILEFDPDRNRLLLRSGKGWQKGLVGGLTIPADKNSQAGYTLLTNRPVVVENLVSEYRFSGPKLLTDHGVISGVSVIIGGLDKPFGVLGVHTKTKRIFTQNDIDFIQSMANVLAQAIERRQSEIILRESRQRARLLFYHAPIMIHSIDPKGRLLEVNEHWLEMLGYKREEVIGRPSTDFMTEDTVQMVEEKVRPEFFKTGVAENVPIQLVTRDGGIVETLCSANAGYNEQGEAAYSLAVFEDVTRRLEAERALKESEQRYRLLVHQSPIGVVHHDMEGVIVDVNDSYAKMVGASRDDLLGFNALKGIHDSEMIKALQGGLSGKTGVFKGEYIAALTGKRVEINAVIRGIRDSDGTLIGSIAIVEDITDRLKAEKELQESETLLNEMGRMAKVGGWRLEADNLEIHWTKETYRIHGVPLGYKPVLEEAINFYHPDDRDILKRSVALALEKGRPYDLELRLITAKGDQIWTRSICKPVIVNGKTIRLTGAFQDITERKRMEELLRIQRDLGTALGVTEDLKEALDICLESALQVGTFDCGGIYLVDPLKGDINMMVQKGLSPEFSIIALHYEADSPQARLIAKGKPVFKSYDQLLDSIGLAPEKKKIREKMDLRSTAVVPILHEKKVIAALNVASRTSDIIPEFAAYSLEAIASQVAGALTKIEADQALKTSQRNLHSLFGGLDDFLFVLDSYGNIVGYNPVVEKRLGYSVEELAGLNVLDVHPPDRREEAAAIVKEMLEGRATHCPIPLLTKSGNLISVETKVTLGTWDNQDAIFGISRDITERIEAEKARQLSEERLWAAIDAIDEGFALYDAEDRLTMFNAKYIEIYKESAEALVPGARFEDVIRYGAEHGQYAGATGRVDEYVADRMELHNSANSSFEQKLDNGRWLKISECKTRDGSTVGFRVDITDIKRSEERTREALKEKEALLREIHHRVKNNMQVVSSLLSLQADKIDDQRALNAFTEAESRVQSMAFVHETLYQSENLSEINFQLYLESLTDHILQVYTPMAGSASIEIQAEEVTLKVEYAVPCGLIVTELVTNALKYAVPTGSGLEIKLKAAYEPDNRIVMTIADNGSGLPPDFDIHSIKTLGLRLVTELVTDQLEGDWKLDQEQGACWLINWLAN